MAIRLREEHQQKINLFSLGTILILILLNIIFIVSLKLHQVSTSDKERTLKQAIDKKNTVLVNLNSLDMSIRGYLLTENPAFKETFYKMKSVQIKDFQTLDSLLHMLSYNPVGYEDLKKTVIDYYDLMEGVIGLKEKNRYTEAIEIINEDKGTEVWLEYVDFSKNYDAFINESNDKITRTGESLIFINLSLEILLGIIGIPILIFIIYLLISTTKRNRKLLEKLKHQNNTILKKQDLVESLDSEIIVNELVENIKDAATFVEKLTEGDYKISWKGYDQADKNGIKTLSGRLISLKNRLLKIELEREERTWFNEGVNKLSESVRIYQVNHEEFYDQILTFTIKYLKVIQGGLFVFNEHTKTLQLKATYAYNRKKFLEKDIKIGEGLVGQTYLEKEPTHIRNASNDYTFIQSGLGESKPLDIYILPIVNNDEVVGIMELVSFEYFEQKHIKFLNKLSEIVGSSIYVQLNNEKTKLLLEKSQEQAEALRAQEEEIRQNSEELQATQEEMSRQNHSLQNEISILQEKLRSKEMVGKQEGE